MIKRTGHMITISSLMTSFVGVILLSVNIID
jgi:hypothetical protein